MKLYTAFLVLIGAMGNGTSHTFIRGVGRVEDGRGSLGPMANAPFPIPARQTGRADFRHPAFRLASPQGTRRQTNRTRLRHGE
jgi:hypothetical protein